MGPQQPADDTTMISFRCSHEMAKRIRYAADQAKVPMSIVCRIAVMRLLGSQAEISPVQKLVNGEMVPVPYDEGEAEIGIRRKAEKMSKEAKAAARFLEQTRNGHLEDVGGTEDA